MAKIQKNDAVWVEIDPATLDAQAQAQYKAYKDLYKQAKEAQARFEEMVNDSAGLPEGKRLVFGYRFGKLSAAVVEKEEVKAKTSPQKLSLSAYMAQQKAQGRA